MEEDTPAGHIGERLKLAREASGRSIEDISSQIKVRAPLLDAIERGAVEELPAGPYATGFVRTYATAVGIDAEEAVAEVRQMIAEKNLGLVEASANYEPADTDRIPPRPLVWTALLIAGLLVLGYIGWRTFTLPSDDSVETNGASAPARPATAAAPAAPATPSVTIPADAVIRIAARETAYFSLEDADGRSQFDLTLDSGEFYTVRPAQRSLILRTNRPQALRVLAGNIELPPIGPPDTVATIGLDSASLSRAASNGATTLAPSATAAPGPVGVRAAPAPRPQQRSARPAPSAAAPVAEPPSPPVMDTAPANEPAPAGDAG